MLNASYNLISCFNDGHVMSACPEFSFSFQIGIALANLDFTEKLASVFAVMS